MSDAGPEAPASRDDRLAWVSWLKVIAIVAVVVLHGVGLNAVAEGALSTGRGKVAAVLYYVGMFGVPLFVMVSGALLLDPTRYKGPEPFVRKRVARLVPPLIFWHAWYLGLIYLTWGKPPSPLEALGFILTGKLYTALYFFWIILGLALLVPVLVPFLRETTPRAVLLLTAGGLAIPVLTSATRVFRKGAQNGLEMPWTWWVPYIGAFLLGYVLRRVSLRGAKLLAAMLGLAVLVGVQVLQGITLRAPDRDFALEVPDWVTIISPPGYYGFLLLLQTALLFVVVKSLVEDGGALAFLGRGRWGRLAHSLGGVTMGVFGFHLTALYVVRRFMFPEDGQVAASMSHMLVRLVVVLVASFAVALVLRRVPFVRRVV